jgi:hypothetical protein
MTRHLIGELVFDIAIDSRNRTMREDAYLRRLVTATLLPVVEQVFDGFDDGDTVLVLDSLEIDLGDIGQADYEDTAVKRLRAALADALHRALADARQARGAGGGSDHADGAASIVSRHESELAQLGRFLATGTLPWHADIGQARLHEALLDRLLARPGTGLWAVLARALADPRSARRLVAQFPNHQLLAVLRGSAGARAGQFEALLAELRQVPSGADLAAAAWVHVLAACTAAGAAAAAAAAADADADADADTDTDTDVDVQAACARIRTALAPSATAALAQARARAQEQAPLQCDLDALAHFLDSGALRAAPDGLDQPTHHALLERLLEHGGESLRAVLARALAHPGSARRLVAQFTERQLLAVLRRMAGAGAAQFESLLGEAFQPPPGGAGRAPAALWAQVLAACTDPAGVDAQMQCARIRASLARAAGKVDAPSIPDIDLLAQFLDSGQLPAGLERVTSQLAHEALLERLLMRGEDSLWAVLARALADQRSAHRLVAQFPERQLLAIVRSTAGARAEPFETLLAEAKFAPAAWMQVLAACTGNAGAVDAQADCARIRAVLGRLTADAGAGAPAKPDIDLLAEFLGSGQLPGAAGGAVGQPAHEALLERLLAHGAASLWPVLSDALAAPHSARRLVEQFPQHQLLAVLRQAAGADAVQFEALLAEVWQSTGGTQSMSMAWRQVLAEGMARPLRRAGAGVELALARIRAVLSADLSVGGQPDSTAAAPGPAGRVLTPISLLATAIAVGAQPAAERFPGNRLPGLRKHAASAASARRLAGLAAIDAGAASAMTWRRLPADLSQSRLVQTKKNSAAAMPVQSLPEWTRALLGLLTGFLAGARLPGAPSGAPGAPAHEALLACLLAEGGAAVWPALARTLADPACARRMVEHFPQHQVRAVMQRLAPAQARRLGALLAGINRNPAAVIGTGGQAERAAPAARRAGQVTPVARLQDGLPARSDDRPRASDDAIESPGRQGAPPYRTQLRYLRQFLEGGVLPVAAVGTDQGRPHEALLDDLIEHADDALWRIVAHALEQDDSAARLLTQFPQRQLIALGAKSAPGYAPALERLVRRLSAMPADGSIRQAQVGRRHVLAACVARPALKAWPALVVARMALELSGTAAPEAQARYARRLDAHPADASMPWRASVAEHGAGLALVRLAGMVEQFRPLIDHRVESTSASASAPAPAVAASCPGLGLDLGLGLGLGLVLRQRQQMARRLRDECRALQALLSGGTAREDGPGAARIDDVPTLRTNIAARVSANPAIAPRRRELMLDSIEARLAEAAEPAGFLRGVLAALMTGAPLDLDALLAPESPVAPASQTPTHMLAAALTAGDAAAVFAQWQALLERHAPHIRAGLRHYGRSATVRRALAHALPGAIFLDLAGLLDDGAPAVLRELLTPSAPLQDAVGRGAKWDEWTMRCRLHALATLTGAADGERRIEAGAFLRGVAPADSRDYAELVSALPPQFGAAPGRDTDLETASTPASQSGVTFGQRQKQQFQQQQQQAQAQEQEQEQEQEQRPAPASRVGDPAAPVFPEPVDSTDLLVVGNAGMVLAGPYLPRLFSALGLTVDGKFIDEHAAGRAVHLLQYMVTGESHSPEYLLVLNKILCGLPTAAAVSAGIDITQAEHECIEGMIHAMVAHAKVLGSCSVAAMRQTFFARKADLQLIDDAWQLRVHPGTFDMLLDRLPWSYSIVKFGWMARPVHVEWRPT